MSDLENIKNVDLKMKTFVELEFLTSNLKQFQNDEFIVMENFLININFVFNLCYNSRIFKIELRF